MDLNNDSTEVLVVRFDGKDHELQPGLNKDVPDTLAGYALRQHPDHVTKVRPETGADVGAESTAMPASEPAGEATADEAADVADDEDDTDAKAATPRKRTGSTPARHKK